jgi:hypothetical protein
LKLKLSHNSALKFPSSEVPVMSFLDRLQGGHVRCHWVHFPFLYSVGFLDYRTTSIFMSFRFIGQEDNKSFPQSGSMRTVYIGSFKVFSTYLLLDNNSWLIPCFIASCSCTQITSLTSQGFTEQCKSQILD